MRKFFKTDIKEAASKRFRNQAGFLVLPDCVLACSGVLQYGDVVDQDGKNIADGDIINVYRPASALKSCIKQFANLPLTLTHPQSQKVDPGNAKEVTVGSLGSNPKYEERDGKGYVVCDIIVYDEDTISKIEDGEYEELSAGYETAFQRQRGMEDGQQYEAIQFLLIPNHVALVEKGRCGSECKVCDNAPSSASKNNNKKETEMKKVVRYLLQMADGDEEAVTISKEQAEKIMEENPEIEVEEMDEDEVTLQEVGTDSKKRRKKDEEEEDFEEASEEDFEEDEEEDFEEEEEIIDGCGGGGKKRRKEDEDELEDLNPEPSETDEEEDDMVYEVQFDDGTVGKMDENSYKHVSRFLELNKKGDAAETIAKATLLTSNAAKVLGPTFDVTKFIANDSIDYTRIKKAIIKKVMPAVVTTSLKGDALEHIYKSAMETFKNKRKSWEEDIAGISNVVAANDTHDSSPVEEARANYLKRQKNI